MKPFCKNKISWSGIISGLIVGLLLFVSTMMLGVLLMAWSNLDLIGTGGVLGLIWTALSLIGSSYIAGVVAMAVVQPDQKIITVEEDATEVETTVHRFRKEAKLTGLITGSLIVLLTTYLTASGVGAALTGASKIAGTTVAAVGATAGAAGTAGVVGLGSIDEIRNYVSSISRGDIENLVAENIEGLTPQQVSRVVTAFEDIMKDSQMRIKHEYSLRNLPAAVSKEYATIREELTAERLSKRLSDAGISEAEIKTVQSQIDRVVKRIELQLAQFEKDIERLVKQVENTIALTALTWIISSILVLGATILGAMSMAHTEEEHETKKSMKKPMHRK